MGGDRPPGHRVVLYDDDHYYLGGVLAELLASEGYEVTLVTPAADVSAWTHHTLEQHRIAARLLEAGVVLRTHLGVDAVAPGGVTARCVHSGREEQIEADSVVLVTARLPEDRLALDLEERRDRWPEAGLQGMRAVGDAYAPGTIASAVWDGRRFAEAVGGPDEEALFRRDLPSVGRLPERTQ
jgi:dimethylamine/trimethylamine dehydrogenase